MNRVMSIRKQTKATIVPMHRTIGASCMSMIGDSLLVQVDAFADKAFYGNPAAVLLQTKQDAAQMDEETRQKIAAEMNLSETSFVELQAGAKEDGSFASERSAEEQFLPDQSYKFPQKFSDLPMCLKSGCYLYLCNSSLKTSTVCKIKLD